MTWQLMMVITTIVCFVAAYWIEKRSRDVSLLAGFLTLFGFLSAFVVWFDTLTQLPDYYKPGTTIESQIEENKRQELREAQRLYNEK